MSGARKIHNKLVRDKIPEIIRANGDSCSVRVLSQQEYKKELLKKIVEEAQEVLKADNDKKELTKELADVLEVLHYIITAFKLDKEEVEKVRQKRKESRGAFDKRLFLEYTEDGAKDE